MRSTVTKRGQTVIPAAVRRQFNITSSDRLEWIVENNTIRIVPVKKDPINAFRGRGVGGATARLLQERAADLESE